MLEAQVNKHLAEVQAHLQTGREKVYEGIVLTPMMNQISEEVFRNFYLPCFAGFVNPPNWIMNWTQVAGSPMAEVLVVDNEGRALFQVPPLLASSKAFLVNRAGGLKDIFDRHEMLKNSISADHSNYVYNALDDKIKELPENHTQNAKEVWNTIFARYGISPVSSQQAGQPGAPSQGGNSDDLFEY